MDGEVKLRQEERGGVLILHFKGRLDAVSAPPAEKQIMDIIGAGHSKLVLEFSEVEYLSSAGMRLLLASTKRVRTSGGKLVLCQVGAMAMDVLKMSGFDHVLEIVPNLDDALKKF